MWDEKRPKTTINQGFFSKICPNECVRYGSVLSNVSGGYFLQSFVRQISTYFRLHRSSETWRVAHNSPSMITTDERSSSNRYAGPQLEQLLQVQLLPPADTVSSYSMNNTSLVNFACLHSYWILNVHEVFSSKMEIKEKDTRGNCYLGNVDRLNDQVTDRNLDDSKLQYLHKNRTKTSAIFGLRMGE